MTSCAEGIRLSRKSACRLNPFLARGRLDLALEPSLPLPPRPPGASSPQTSFAEGFAFSWGELDSFKKAPD